jgi:hypothetical protein
MHEVASQLGYLSSGALTGMPVTSLPLNVVSV